MGRKRLPPENNYPAIVDEATNELFASLKTEEPPPATYMSYIPSFFTTASLPFKNVNKTSFRRKGSNGVTLTITSPFNVPFGKFGRLLLSVLTTHAVLSKNKRVPVMIEYNALADLLRELQLPKQRGREIREQLECFKGAAFCFEQRIETFQKRESLRGIPLDSLSEGDVRVETTTTGSIQFTSGIQFQKITDDRNGSWFGNFKIILSADFAAFCQSHAVPINYSVYKEISSASGKDIYAWLVYRNNGLNDTGKASVFVSRDKLVEQFMSLDSESGGRLVSTYYSRICDEIKEIKRRYYKELNVDLSDPSGITLFKSPTPVLKEDTRYALITSTI